jgi:hypothetical protein
MYSVNAFEKKEGRDFFPERACEGIAVANATRDPAPMFSLSQKTLERS